MREGQSDQLMFDPTEDESNAQRLVGKTQQLSCARCFGAIAYTNEATNLLESPFAHDYQVRFDDVDHVKLD